MSERTATNVSGSSGRVRVVRAVLTETSANRGGWRDGRFGATGTPIEDRDPSGLEGDDRRSYCRGYREGLRVRRMLGRA